MTTRQHLVERVRAALQEHRPREVRMFGGVSFLVDDRMIVAARRDDSLLLRIDPGDAAELLGRPGAQPACMGADRPMGDGWISIEPEALQGAELTMWLGEALEHHAAQTEEQAMAAAAPPDKTPPEPRIHP